MFYSKAQTTCQANFTYIVGSNGQVSFSNTSTGAVGANPYYHWDFGDESNDLYQFNPGTHSFVYNGTYNVTLGIGDSSFMGTGCNSYTTEVIVITNATPCNLNVNFTYTVGSNGQINITNTSTGSSSSTIFNWYFNNQNINSTSTNSLVLGPLYNGTYSIGLGAYNTNGICAGNYSTTVTITNGLTCNIHPSFTYSIGTGGVINFTNTSTGLPAYPFYEWSFWDGTSSFSSNPNPPPHNCQYNGQYIVGLNIFDSLWGSCNASIIDTINITNGTPCALQASFTYTLGANGHVDFTNTSTGTSSLTPISWFGDFQNDSTYGVSANYPYNGTYSVTLQEYNYGTPCASSVTHTFVITNSTPCTINSSFTYSIGSNGQVSFTNTATGLPNFYKVNWDFGNGTTAFFINNLSCNTTYTQNGTYYVTLTIADSSGWCSQTFGDSITINTIIPCLLNVNYTYTTGNNGLINFANTSSGVPANPVISWNFGDGSISPLNNPTHTYVYNGTYYTTLNISDSSGYCQNSYDDSVNVTNGQTCNLVTNFTYTIGGNGQVSFTNISSGIPTNPITYWDFGDGNMSTLSNPTNTYTASGNYYVTFYITDSSGICYSYIQDTVVITNAPCINPTVSFNLFKDTTQVGLWYAIPNYSNNVNSVVWYWGDGNSTSAFYPSHIYSSPNSYNICVTVFNSCGDSINICQSDSIYRLTYNSINSNMIEVNVLPNAATGISQISGFNSQISIYPNPSNGNFIIETNTSSKQAMQVYDVNGRLVLTQTILSKTTIDANILTDGVYNISITGNEGVVNKKLVIVK